MTSNGPNLNPDPFEPYLLGTISDAWTRCLEVWSERGRVQDLPRGIRYTSYSPSFGVRLGRAFVERFSGGSAFLLERFTFGNPLERVCAFDLLDLTAQHLYEIDAPLPDILRSCELLLQAPVREEVEADWIYRGRGLDTVGKLLVFEHNGQEEVPERLSDYRCSDYFASARFMRGVWSESEQFWLVVPAGEIVEGLEREFLVVGSAGVDGIRFGYRRDQDGIWAHYPMEDNFALVAPGIDELVEGWLGGSIKV